MPGGLFPPIEVIGSWDINYVDPPRSGEGIIIMTAVLIGVTWMVVGMRLYARFYLVKSAGIDDALVIFAMVRFYNGLSLKKLLTRPLSVPSIRHGRQCDLRSVYFLAKRVEGLLIFFQ
jgi:hypothetical protein